MTIRSIERPYQHHSLLKMTTLRELLRLRHSRLAPVLALAATVAILGLAGLPSSLAAAILTEDANGRMLVDSTANGEGNILSAPNRLGRVGEVSADANQARYYMPFVLSSEERADAANARRIVLSFFYANSGNVSNVATGDGPVDLTVDLYGYQGRVTEVPVVDDYQSTNVVLLRSSVVTTTTGSGYQFFDVTDFVKEQAAAGGVVAFRLQVVPAEGLPNQDGIVNRYTFYTHLQAGSEPRLEMVFERRITGGSVEHRNITDTTGDGLGNVVHQPPPNETLGRVGELTLDSDQSRWYLPFELTAGELEAVLAADLVTLNYSFGTRTHVTGLVVDDGGSVEVSENPTGRNITDTTGDGLGNVVQASDNLARVGERTRDVDQTRYFLPFVLSEEVRQAVADGQRINLRISYGASSGLSNLAIDGELVNLRMDIYGYVGRTSEVPEAGDYQDSDVVLLVPGALAPGVPTGVRTFDVTEFVKEQSALGPVVAFRYQIDPPEALPYADVTFNRFLLHTHAHATSPAPKLEIFPEWPVPTVDLAVDVVGFVGRETLSATPADYHATNVAPLASPIPDLTMTALRSLNITDFAKQEAAGGSILAFRFQIDQPEMLPRQDSLLNRYLFHSPNHPNFPYIQIVDELPFRSWRQGFFTEAGLGNVEISGPLADPDGDGVTNILEYAFAGDPHEANRDILPFLATAEIEGADYLTVTFTRIHEPFDIRYSVDSTLDLTAWTSGGAVLVDYTDHEDGTATATYRSPWPISGEKVGFLRVLVEKIY